MFWIAIEPRRWKICGPRYTVGIWLPYTYLLCQFVPLRVRMFGLKYKSQPLGAAEGRHSIQMLEPQSLPNRQLLMCLTVPRKNLPVFLGVINGIVTTLTQLIEDTESVGIEIF